jgi:hypothetical protein
MTPRRPCPHQVTYALVAKPAKIHGTDADPADLIYLLAQIEMNSATDLWQNSSFFAADVADRLQAQARKYANTFRSRLAFYRPLVDLAEILLDHTWGIL